jgi:PelA/Pel-15E family pectate lyase
MTKTESKQTLPMLLFLKTAILLLTLSCKTPATQQNTAIIALEEDAMAERMLLYQRNNGGWPQPGGDAIDYKKEITETLKTKLLSEKSKLDATIDDQATTKEIKYLVTIFKKTNHKKYLEAAENGINYLLSAQNTNGGWPQFYPDSSGYRKHITYNDNAMIDVLNILKYTAEATNDFDVIDKNFTAKAQQAVSRGIACILKTQYKQKDKLTVWCAQHDKHSLLPVKARAFELPSLSGAESVNIVYFLMAIDKPDAPIKNAIKAAVAWFETHKIVGINIKTIQDTNQPSGKDRVVIQDPDAMVWARFYDLDTNKPFFVGRDSVPKSTLAEIENERRIGYAYYGIWPKKLLTKDYPEWLKKWER